MLLRFFFFSSQFACEEVLGFSIFTLGIGLKMSLKLMCSDLRYWRLPQETCIPCINWFKSAFVILLHLKICTEHAHIGHVEVILGSWDSLLAMSSVIIYKLGLGLATFLVLWKQCWTCNHLGESESKEQPIHTKIVI